MAWIAADRRSLPGLLVAVLAACTPAPVPMDASRIVYDDGDTIRFEGRVLRVAGIDTPEIAHPEHGILRDQPYGREAARRTQEILTAAERVEYLPCGRDRYGRTLAHVFADGELLAVKLIREGLAYETVSFYGDNGFPELALAILEEAAAAGEPPFEPPWKWKARTRRR